MSGRAGARALAIDRALLRRWRLPVPDADGDKEARGRVLVVGGGAAVPGAIVLAGIAGLRAGAGKLQLATARDSVVGAGMAVPESLVIALPAGRSGEISSAAADRVAKAAAAVDAVLIGPGMLDEKACIAILRRVLPALRGGALVIDAGALARLRAVRRALLAADATVILTPHAGEMARMLGVSRDAIAADPRAIAVRAAGEFGCTIVLKGAQTFVADPQGAALRYDGGSVGLATSGSGDTLAGVIAGLAARGTDGVRAAAWGVYLHGAAGRSLARRVGRIGFLARELLDEIPSEVRRVEGGRRG